MGISILIPCKDRVELLRNTLESYKKYNDMKKLDYEILVLSNEHNQAVSDLIVKSDLNIMYCLYDWPKSEWISPCRAFNYGAELAIYDKIVLTNPECRLASHGILEYMSNMSEDCITCNTWDLNPNGERIFNLYSTTYRGSHPGYFFLGCYNKEKYKSIGGFDEIFMKGVAWDDEDFGTRWMRAGFNFTLRDDFIVEHQYHPRRGDRLDHQYYHNKEHFEWNNMNNIIKVHNHEI